MASGLRNPAVPPGAKGLAVLAGRHGQRIAHAFRDV